MQLSIQALVGWIDRECKCNLSFTMHNTEGNTDSLCQSVYFKGEGYCLVLFPSPGEHLGKYRQFVIVGEF